MEARIFLSTKKKYTTMKTTIKNSTTMYHFNIRRKSRNLVGYCVVGYSLVSDCLVSKGVVGYCFD